MPNLTSVTVTAGVPTAGSGTVSTIDALMADGGQATLGAKTDAKSTATDATSVSAMQVLKQISASTQLGASSSETSTVYNGVTALTPKFKVITASSSGATTIVALVGGKKIRVLAWDVKVNAAVNFKWQSHVTPTDLTGLYYNSAQGDGVARAFCPVGYFETVVGEALDINLSGAVAVGGVLTYVEV